jgi:hypothetical protein
MRGLLATWLMCVRVIFILRTREQADAGAFHNQHVGGRVARFIFFRGNHFAGCRCGLSRGSLLGLGAQPLVHNGLAIRRSYRFCRAGVSVGGWAADRSHAEEGRPSGSGTKSKKSVVYVELPS